MSSTEETARPGSWDEIRQLGRHNSYTADCILELRARVERLEQAQQQPEPEPAGGQTLHTVALRMVDTLANLDVLPEITETIRQAIREPMQPAPSTPAGQGELVSGVAEAIRLAGFSGPYEPVQAGILAVADWLASRGWNEAAWVLRREVGR